MRRPAISLLASFLLFVPAQLLASGVVRGKITDKQTREPIAGANVIVVGTSFGTSSGPDGAYSLVNVPVGVHSIRATFIGYAPQTIEGFVVNNDLTTEVNFELTTESISMEPITIVAQRPLINKSATNALRVMTAEDIEAIPVRGLDNFLALTAGVVLQDGNISIRGGRLDETGYYLEGVSITDPHTGGRGLSMFQGALEEISVQSAGYEAEYGRANAGIVQHQLKSGGSEFKASAEYITDNLAFSSRDSWSRGRKRLGSYWFGYNEFNASGSGPIVDQNVRFFGLFHYGYQGDRRPSIFPGISLGLVKDRISGDSINLVYPPGILLKNSEEQYLGTGTLMFDFSPLVLRFSGSYAKTVSLTGGYPWLVLDLPRIPESDTWDGFGSLKGTWFFNPTTYVEWSGGYFFHSNKNLDPVLRDDFYSYGDSIANAAAGYVWQRGLNEQTGRFSQPRWIAVYDIAFAPPGAALSSYEKFERGNISLNAAFASQVSTNHSLKIGGDFQRYIIRTYRVPNPVSLGEIVARNSALADGDPQKQTLEQIMIAAGIENYGFDVLGNKNVTDDFQGARHPIFASAYIQDKAEFSDLTMNLGFRYDYTNTNTYIPIDPEHLEYTFDRNTNQVNPAGLKKTRPYSTFSPRLGAAFPVTDQTVFHIQYAKLVQQSRLRDVIYGMYRFGSLAAGGGSVDPIGFDLRPTRTTQYEIGFTQQIGDFASFDLTGYYKDIKDQIVIVQQQSAKSSPFPNYTKYVNGDFATTKGIELTLTMRRYKRILASASLSFQDARGTGSFARSNLFRLNYQEDTTFYPQYVSPLDYMNAVRGSVSVDFRFGRDDGGPVLQELGASLLLAFSSGHPYTRTSPTTGIRPIESLNSSTTPWTFQLDFRMDKVFRIGDALNAILSFYVINLLDTKNVQNVFPETGSPDDDGYLSNPDYGGKLIASNGPQYAELYRALFLSYQQPYPNFATLPYFFGPPRQIRLGIKLEY